MEKTSKSLSDKERKEIIDKLFSDLETFGEGLKSVIDINYMIRLNELYEFEKNNQLKHEIIDSSTKEIVTYLSNAFDPLADQLIEYWNTWGEIFKEKPEGQISLREITDQYLPHMLEVDSMFKEVTNENPSETNKTDLYALLLVHVIAVEKIEHPLMKDIQKYSTSTVDWEKMFSVGEKVERNGSFETHARAIRIAIAHKKFTIKENKIIFSNKDNGFNFEETFEINHFVDYVKFHQMLLRIMFMLQSLIMLTTLLHESLDI